ncbi:MAG: hypothetical protein V1724_06125, partial [Chloroflexota bacterium]
KPVLDEIEQALQKEEKLFKENEKRRNEAAQRGEEPQLVDADVLFPVRLDDYVLQGWNHCLKPKVCQKFMGDFRGWQKPQEYQAALRRLLNALDPESWPLTQ